MLKIGRRDRGADTVQMAGIAGLDEVLARTGMSVRCLRRPCSKEHLLEIAKRLTNWRNAAPWLGLDPASVETWDYDGHLNEEGKRQKMLTEWKQRKGCEATYEALANVLLKVDRTDLAEELLHSLKGTFLGDIYNHSLRVGQLQYYST